MENGGKSEAPGLGGGEDGSCEVGGEGIMANGDEQHSKPRSR